MNKICTDILQSKKLIELGIDVQTADMYWWATSLRYYIEAMDDGDFNEAEGHVPAWSLMALIELIPTEDKKDEYYVDTESHSDYHIVNYRNCWDGCIHSEYSEESLLDATYKMVVWLKQNGKLYEKK